MSARRRLIAVDLQCFLACRLSVALLLATCAGPPTGVNVARIVSFTERLRRSSFLPAFVRRTLTFRAPGAVLVSAPEAIVVVLAARAPVALASHANRIVPASR